MRRRLLLLLAFLGLVIACGERAGDRRSELIVIVTVDTLRRDHVGAYAPPGRRVRSLTPRMDRLQRTGLLFEDARTPVPLTLPGHTTMFSGLPPAATGVRVNAFGRIPPEAERGFPLLAERLRGAGWQTGAFVSAAPLAGWHGLDQGFEVYDDGDLEDLTGLAYPERAGTETVDRALDWFAARDPDRPTLLWVHLFEPHAPYGGPPGTPPRRGYALDVAAADAAVGRLLDGLGAAGEAAVVCLTSDHGEALGDLGEATHGILLGDGVLRIPFLLQVPGVAPARRPDPVDLADVAPTLAAAAGVPWPQPHGDPPGVGRDLLAAPVPGDRIRIAESLYPHQRYGWAQLAGAVGRDGMLVDAGEGRAHWLPPPPPGEPQVAPLPAALDAVTRRLNEALVRYKAGERPERMTPGSTAGGYGSAAAPHPFFSLAENGRLPDPYAYVPTAQALDREAARLQTGVRPAAVLGGLEALAARDPGNPEIQFWIGRAETQRFALRGPEGAPDALERAEAAYVRAWELGREDAATLVLAVGTRAVGREEAMVDRLRRWKAEVPPDCRVFLLEARLLRALSRHDEADEACEEAERVCRRDRERSTFEGARKDGTCR